jgi:predicted nuclease of predicted toxin-antitoxin system
MKLWIDAQISSHLAMWITKTLTIDAYSLEYLNLDEAEDETIFMAAREANVVVITKDEDFVHLQKRLGTPPKMIWITCGNTSNEHLRLILENTLLPALSLLESGESLVEIKDAIESSGNKVS